MMADFSPVHVLVYGDSGAGKSTFLATFPKPLLVFCFDPIGKDQPYLRLGVDSGLQEWEFGRWRELIDGKTGETVCRVEYYSNPDPPVSNAYPLYLARTAMFKPEAEGWATVGFDSVTFMELAARKWAQYTLNPGAKEPRQWFGTSTDQLEEQLMLRPATWNVNVVVIAHVDEEKDDFHGIMSRTPKAPGRLRKGLSAGFGEVYRMYVSHSGKEGAQHQAQTRSDALWMALSGVGAPNPMKPHYEQINLNQSSPGNGQHKLASEQGGVKK